MPTLPLYSNTHYSQRGDAWKIDIYDRDDSPVSTKAFIVEHGYDFDYRGDEGDVMESLILPCLFSCDCWVEDEDFEDFIEAINASEEGRYIVYVYRRTLLYWTGIIMPDFNGRKNHPMPYSYTLQATDGYGRLKNIKYDDDGDLYTGRCRTIDHLLNILNKIDIRDYLDPDQMLLTTIVNWYEVQMEAPSHLRDPILLSDIDHLAFHYVDEFGETQAQTCYYVLEQLCKRWQARICQAGGIHFFFQIGEYARNQVEGWISTRSYDPDRSTVIMIESSNYQKAESLIKKLGGGYWIYQVPLKDAKVKYKFKEGVGGNNLLPEDYEILDIESIEVAGGSGEQLVFTGSIRVTYNSNGQPPFPHTIKIILLLTDGTNNFTNQDAVEEWVVDDARWTFETLLVMKKQYIRIIPIGFITPAVPTGGTGNFQVQVEMYDGEGNMITTDLPVGQTFEVEAIDFSLTLLYTTGLLANGTAEWRANNENTWSVETQDIGELLIGDGVNIMSDGRIKVWDGAQWLNSSSWKIGSTGVGVDINILLLLETLALRKTTKEIYVGRIREEQAQEILIVNAIELYGDFYIFLAGTFNTRDAEWNAKWLKVSIDRNSIAADAVRYTKESYQGSMSGISYVTVVHMVIEGGKQGVETLEADVWKQITFDEAFGSANYSISPLEGMTSSGLVPLRIKNITSTGFQVWAAKGCTYRWMAILQS